MKILRLVALVISFLLAIIFFSPKQNLYFMMEKELKKYDVIISNEKFSFSMLGFTLEDATLYIKGVNVATLNKVNISLYKIDVESENIGYAKTSINFENRSIGIDLKPKKEFIKKYKIIKKYFKKQKNGVYKYEYKLF